MKIKALKNFYQNGTYFRAGQIYEVLETTANPQYITIVSSDPISAPALNKRKRQKDTAMKPSEVRQVVMRRK